LLANIEGFWEPLLALFARMRATQFIRPNLQVDILKAERIEDILPRLRARSPADVDAFHAAALSAGGRSDGAPGLRPHDRVRYYAAFVTDPDGNRIEAVTFPSE